MCWKNPRKLFVKQWIWLNKLRNYNVLMVDKWRGPPLEMATGRVFYTRTRPTGHDSWPGLSLFIKQIFFPRPRPALPSPTQPANFQPLTVAQSVAQSIKKKLFSWEKRITTAVQHKHQIQIKLKSNPPYPFKFPIHKNQIHFKSKSKTSTCKEHQILTTKSKSPNPQVKQRESKSPNPLIK